MKNSKSISKLAFVIILIIKCNSSLAQNLTFQGSILVDTNTLTVPVGEIWKIESIMYESINIGNIINYSTGNYRSLESYIVINGNKLLARNILVGTNGYTWEIHLPIWLPAGSTIKAGDGTLSNGTTLQSYGVKYISILRFSN